MTTDRPTITPDPDRDGVILHLPEITHLDTQAWAADVGLTTEGLAALRALLETPADRAAVLRWAADVAESLRQFEPAFGARKAAQVSENVGILRVAETLRRMADETPAAEADTLPAWLYQRFMPDGTGWDSLDEGQRSYWEHQAHAVRRAVARGGFKQPAAGTQTTALDVLRCLADPEPCRWEGTYCITHSWKSDVGRCPHGQAQALLGASRTAPPPA